MSWILMTVAIIFAAANSLILRRFKNRTFKSAGDVFFFNGGVSLVWVVIMSIWSALSQFTFTPLALLFGVIYGVILCLFLYFKTEALANGPVSFTTLIGSCAFIIATGFGVVYASEEVSICQGIGMALILISLIFCINPKKSEEKLSGKWFFHCFMFFLAGGLVGIFYKIFGASPVKSQINAMMLSASVTSAVLFFITGLLISGIKKDARPKISKDALWYVLLSGVAGCVYIRLNVSLSAIIPSAIFFPVSNGALVIISTVAGGVAFKEKFNKIQLLGIILGIIAIVINGCGDAVLKTLFPLY
jgi:drug/metabolite transporter (DMT)-like permease